MKRETKWFPWFAFVHNDLRSRSTDQQIVYGILCVSVMKQDTLLRLQSLNRTSPLLSFLSLSLCHLLVTFFLVSFYSISFCLPLERVDCALRQRRVDRYDTSYFFLSTVSCFRYLCSRENVCGGPSGKGEIVTARFIWRDTERN